MRFILYDDSHSHSVENDIDNDVFGSSVEQYFSFHDILDGDGDNGVQDWKEIKIDLQGDTNPESPFWLNGWVGQFGNSVLDLNRLKSTVSSSC